MTTIIITETPAKAKRIASVAKRFWKDQSFISLCSIPFAPYMRPVYPRGLKWKDYPYIGTPQVKVSTWLTDTGLSWHANLLNDSGEFVPYQMTDDVFKSADNIVFACDPDNRGALAFAMLVEHMLGDNILSVRDFPAVVLTSLDEDYLVKAFEERSTFNLLCTDMLSFGRIKRYFEWNWNVNSQSVFREALSRIGVGPDAPPLSKYSLQLLLWLATNTNGKLLSVAQVVSNMEYWKGTGKYTGHCSLGSPSSYSGILESLTKSGLIHTRRHYVEPTTLGLKFVATLHKDCIDADLPFRIVQWCRLPFEEAKPKIDSYLKSFFGKQKRLLDNA